MYSSPFLIFDTSNHPSVVRISVRTWDMLTVHLRTSHDKRLTVVWGQGSTLHHDWHVEGDCMRV
ncbi:unnamed protein product [Clonostachys rosea f. rosea IK726]|nr:unnamed protein product [Clonostachys rosea f. rosea IK726]